MTKELEGRILDCIEASSILEVKSVQSLWSGFGAIERVFLEGGNVPSVIVKRIQAPSQMNHPRGWNSDVSSSRKMKSYQIEQIWYDVFVPELPTSIKVPQLHFKCKENGVDYIVMEDLEASGFVHGYEQASEEKFNACLHWLANFHAFHLNNPGNGLWEVGSYWHLKTRQEEWERMPAGALKERASELDHVLNNCQFQTIIHGDAKPANFCFSKDNKPAAVDFQYVGRGCGVKDVIYLMSSTLSEEELFAEDEVILERYFQHLQHALSRFNKEQIDFTSLKNEWASMYNIAWADFVRFLEGWSPGHSRYNQYAMQITESAILNS